MSKRTIATRARSASVAASAASAASSLSACSARPWKWATSAATSRASNPPPSSIAARARRSVRAWSLRTRAAMAPARRRSALPPPPASRREATTRTSSRRRAPASSILPARARAIARSRRPLIPTRTTSPYTGWANLSWTLRPSIRLATSPLCSSSSIEAGSASWVAVACPSGSPRASSSRKDLSSPVRSRRRSATSSTRRPVGLIGPARRRTPPSSAKEPVSSAPVTSSAQDHRIALAPFGELPHRGRVNRRAQHRDEQPVDGRVLEKLHLEALRRTVLPQRHDGVRRRLTREHRGHHRRRTGPGELVKQRRRSVVEEVGVVHEDDERLTLCRLDERPRVTPQQLAVVAPPEAVGARVGGQDGGEGPERQPTRGAGRDRRRHGHAPLAGDLEAGRHQSGLADPGRSDDDGAPSLDDCREQLAQFTAPADQRPFVHARVYLWPP